MAIVVNERDVAAEPFGVNVKRQRLLTQARVKGTHVLLDRWALGPGAVAKLEVPAGNLAWFQMLEGEVELMHAGGEERLTAAHIVLLPPAFRGTLASRAGATLLRAEVPDAGRFDPAFAKNPPQLRGVGW